MAAALQGACEAGCGSSADTASVAMDKLSLCSVAAALSRIYVGISLSMGVLCSITAMAVLLRAADAFRLDGDEPLVMEMARPPPTIEAANRPGRSITTGGGDVIITHTATRLVSQLVMEMARPPLTIHTANHSARIIITGRGDVIITYTAKRRPRRQRWPTWPRRARSFTEHLDSRWLQYTEHTICSHLPCNGCI